MPISEALYSSKTDMWETPQDLFNELDKEFHFDMDVCATQENAKCKRYYTPKQDGLSQPWDGICWCNPPYGRDIGQWVRRALFASFGGATVVMLLPARTDTKWFHDYIYSGNKFKDLDAYIWCDWQPDFCPNCGAKMDGERKDGGDG